MKFFFYRKKVSESSGIIEAKEALARVESDAPKVEELRIAHEARLKRNDFGPKFAAALHLRRNKW